MAVTVEKSQPFITNY